MLQAGTWGLELCCAIAVQFTHQFEDSHNQYFAGILLQGHLESANVIGGYRNITNYHAKHTPTKLEYQLEDVNLMYYVSVLLVYVRLPCVHTMYLCECPHT